MVYGGRAYEKLKLTQGMLLWSCSQYTNGEVVYALSFFYELLNFRHA